MPTYVLNIQATILINAGLLPYPVNDYIRIVPTRSNLFKTTLTRWFDDINYISGCYGYAFNDL